jgi:hypothetical protein
MNKIAEIMNGALSAILIAFGYAALWCGIFCLIGHGVGNNLSAEFGWILMCGMGCVIFGVILMVSGIAWYFIVKPKS